MIFGKPYWDDAPPGWTPTFEDPPGYVKPCECGETIFMPAWLRNSSLHSIPRKCDACEAKEGREIRELLNKPPTREQVREQRVVRGAVGATSLAGAVLTGLGLFVVFTSGPAHLIFADPFPIGAIAFGGLVVTFLACVRNVWTAARG